MVGNIAPVTADHGKVTIGDFIATTDITYGTQPYDAENVKEAAVFGDQVLEIPTDDHRQPELPAGCGRIEEHVARAAGRMRTRRSPACSRLTPCSCSR